MSDACRASNKNDGVGPNLRGSSLKPSDKAFNCAANDMARTEECRHQLPGGPLGIPIGLLHHTLATWPKTLMAAASQSRFYQRLREYMLNKTARFPKLHSFMNHPVCLGRLNE